MWIFSYKCSTKSSLRLQFEDYLVKSQKKNSLTCSFWGKVEGSYTLASLRDTLTLQSNQYNESRSYTLIASFEWIQCIMTYTAQIKIIWKYMWTSCNTGSYTIPILASRTPYRIIHNKALRLCTIFYPRILSKYDPTTKES